MALDKSGVDRPRDEVRLGGEPRQKLEIAAQSEDRRLGKGGRAPSDRACPILAPGDDLGDHGVVIGRDRIALPHPGIDPRHLRRRKAQAVQPPGLRDKIACGVLGIEPRLDRMAAQTRSSWRNGSGSPAATRNCHSTRSNPVTISVTGCSTWSRVFISRKKNLPACGNELDRAGADITDRARRGDRGLAHCAARRSARSRCRRFLDHLLMAALDRAIALEQMDRVAVRVGEDLHLDVARPGQVLLDQHPVVAEGRGGFALCAFERCGEFAGSATTRMPRRRRRPRP